MTSLIGCGNILFELRLKQDSMVALRCMVTSGLLLVSSVAVTTVILCLITLITGSKRYTCMLKELQTGSKFTVNRTSQEGRWAEGSQEAGDLGDANILTT